MKNLLLILILAAWCGAGTVTIHVGDNWQTLVTANPAGTFFWIDSGTHIKQSVTTPKARDTFCGAVPVLVWAWPAFTVHPGATMHGHDSTYTAFAAADSVYIKDLYVTHYKTTFQTGVVYCGSTGANGKRGCTVRECIIDSNLVNGGFGIIMGKYATVIKNVVRYIREEGIADADSNSICDSNDVSYSNFDWFYDNNYAAGAKFTGVNLLCRYNRFHHNVGIGLWADCGAYNTTFTNNIVDSNAWGGIRVEISTRGIIANNTCTRNCDTFYSGGWTDAQICVAGADSFQIYDNTCTVHKKYGGGIRIYGTQTRGNKYYDNATHFDSARGDCGITSTTSIGDTFTNNTYYVPASTFNPNTQEVNGCVKLQH